MKNKNTKKYNIILFQYIYHHTLDCIIVNRMEWNGMELIAYFLELEILNESIFNVSLAPENLSIVTLII